MAGVVTITELTWKSVNKITFDWTATTGEADATTTGYYDGQVLRIVNVATSSTKGNLLINDGDGIDLLGGQGTRFSSGGGGNPHDWGTSTGPTSTGGNISWSPLSVVSSRVTLEVAGASATSTGKTIVYIR